MAASLALGYYNWIYFPCSRFSARERFKTR